MIGTATAAARVLDDAQRIAICGHERPDGDSLGSVAALWHCLTHYGKNVQIWAQTPVPKYYADILPIFSESGEHTECDLLVCVDFAEKKRADITFTKSLDRIPRLIIDHHPNPPAAQPHETIYQDETAAATACLIHEIREELSVPLTIEYAQAMYIALSTDTGNFTYGNTNRRVFEIMCELMDTGIDVSALASRSYDNWRMSRVRLLAAALNTITEIDEGRAALLYVDENMFADAHADEDDAMDFVNYPRTLANVEVAAALTDVPGENTVRINLRSKRPVWNVSILAQKYGGGGHACAAGARVEGNVETFLPEFRKALEEYMHSNGSVQ